MKKFFISLVVLAFSLCSINLFAGGSQVYPNGAEGFLVAAVPPPGFYGVNYFAMLNATKLIDNRGNVARFPNGKRILDHATIWADVLRTIWISKYKLLNGNYGQHFFIPLLQEHFKFNVPVGPASKSGYSDFYIPYIIYSPFILAHHWLGGKLHTVFSLPDIYTPGMSDDDNFANFNHNYWTFEPVFAVTYLPGPWEISLKFMYDFSTKENDHPTPYGVKLDRTPGQEFHFDYNISYAVNKKFRIGFGGYWYQQTTDDDYDDIEKTVNNSNLPAPAKPVVINLIKNDEENHSKQFAIGPGVWFQVKKFFVTFRYQQTIYERNAPKLKNFWVKVIWRY